MDDKTCKRCGFIAYDKRALILHLNRQKPCIPHLSDVSRIDLINEISAMKIAATPWVCKTCNKRFAYQSGLSRHAKECGKQKRVTESQPIVESKEALASQQILDLMKQVEDMKIRMEMMEKQSSTNHITINNNTFVNGNINIDGLGKEDVSYMKEKPAVYNKFMLRCIENNIDGVCDFLVKKHFSPKRPTNHNLKKLNKKDNLMHYYDGKSWQVDTCTVVLDKVFSKIRQEFDKYSVDPNVATTPWFQNTLMNFKRSVVAPLNWGDLEGLGPGVTVNSDDLRKLKKRIFKLAKELIYVNTQSLLQQHKQIEPQ